jgi:hypothetical protein
LHPTTYSSKVAEDVKGLSCLKESVTLVLKLDGQSFLQLSSLVVGELNFEMARIDDKACDFALMEILGNELVPGDWVSVLGSLMCQNQTEGKDTSCGNELAKVCIEAVIDMIAVLGRATFLWTSKTPWVLAVHSSLDEGLCVYRC